MVRRSALMFLLSLVCAPVRAQTAVGGGFTAYDATASFGMPEAIACNSEHAYVRDGMGHIARFGGSRLFGSGRELLPATAPSFAGFGALDVTESGVVFSTGSAVDRFDGSWSSLRLSVRAPSILAIDRTHALAASDGALVGIDFSRGAVERYDAGTWRTLLAIDGAGSDFWVVGQGGTALHWTGGVMQAHPLGRDVWLEGVDVAGPDDVWAWAPEYTRTWERGVSGVFHWDGRTWTERSVAGREVESVIADASHALAVTENDLYRWNGSGWDPLLAAPTRELESGCHTRDRVFVIDTRGAVLSGSWP